MMLRDRYGGRTFRSGAIAALAGSFVIGSTLLPARAQDRPTGQGFSFRTSVALIAVSATVTDGNGRFVSGLSRDDFEIYENGVPQTITQFDAERVPVSLGIALDTSGSMIGEKIVAAQAALNRFLFDLLGENDEVFLYRFDSRPTLVQPWTTDRGAAARMLGGLKPVGGTAIYDTVAEALPLAQSGSRRKKALVVISDGNDTSSQTQLDEVQLRIRESEVLVYAIGIDASDGGNYAASRSAATGRPSGGQAGGATAGSGSRPPAVPRPSPFPGAKPPAKSTPPAPSGPPPPPAPASLPGGARRTSSTSDRVNPDALRALTDDSGGRTEIIVSARDLDPATAGIADELSKQYFIGYVSTLPRDGKWHTIDVRVKRGGVLVRARRGFIAN
jgi:VWFA-related protein